MSDRHLKWLAWAMAGTAIILVIASAVFVALDPGPQFTYWGSGLGFGVSYSLIGALVISRFPRHRMGWLFCATAIWGLESLTGAYGAFGLAQPIAPPAAIWSAWISEWLWRIGAMLVTIILLLFPSGHLVSRRWAPVLWAFVASTLISCVSLALYPGHPPTSNIGFVFSNPVSLPAAQPLLITGLDAGAILFNVGTAFALPYLIVRLARSRGQERLQLKWFAFAGAVSISLLILGNTIVQFLTVLFGRGGTLFGDVVIGPVVSALMPAAAGIAILLYRLYDIDVIIRRTLIYGLLIALLVSVYYMSVVLFEQLFFRVTGQQQSDAVIVLSTLAIAALFNPLRTRIQAAIDLRFYRRKYDAAQVLAAFGQVVRNEVDLNQLNEDLVGVVEQILQPANVSLWVKAVPLSRSGRLGARTNGKEMEDRSSEVNR